MRLGDAGHRIGGELSAACACTRAGDTFELMQFGIGDRPGRTLSDGFEHIHES